MECLGDLPSVEVSHQNVERYVCPAPYVPGLVLTSGTARVRLPEQSSPHPLFTKTPAADASGGLLPQDAVV